MFYKKAVQAKVLVPPKGTFKAKLAHCPDHLPLPTDVNFWQHAFSIVQGVMHARASHFGLSSNAINRLAGGHGAENGGAIPAARSAEGHRHKSGQACRPRERHDGGEPNHPGARTKNQSRWRNRAEPGGRASHTPFQIYGSSVSIP